MTHRHGPALRREHPRRASPAPARRGEHGIALVLTATLGFLLMALFVTAVRAGRDAIRGERFQVLREQRAEGVTASLADGLALLRTGLPPVDPYACVVSQIDDDGNEYDCKVTFTLSGLLQYDVQAVLATEEEMSTLPVMPAGF